MVRLYAGLATETSTAAFCSLHRFLCDHLSDLTNPNSDLMEPAFNTLVMFLRTSQSYQFLQGVLFRALPEIVSDFRLPLFKFTNTLCGELAYLVTCFFSLSFFSFSRCHYLNSFATCQTIRTYEVRQTPTTTQKTRSSNFSDINATTK